MNTKTIVLSVIAAASAVVGCVSVESIKGQMAVDKVGAENTILTVAKTRHDPNGFQRFMPDQCIELAGLLDDTKKCELIKDLARPYNDPYVPSQEDYAVLLGLLKNVDGSTATAAANDASVRSDQKKSTGRGMKSSGKGLKFEGGKGSVGSGSYAIQVVCSVANSMAAKKNEQVQAQLNRIIGTIKDKNVLLSITNMEYADYRVRRHVIPAQFAKILVEQNDLRDFLLGRFDGQSHEEEIENAVLAKINDPKVLIELLSDNRLQNRALEKITDETVLTDIALNIENGFWQSELSTAGANAVKKINNSENLVNIALMAKNNYVALTAREKLSLDDYLNGFTKVLSEGELSEQKAVQIVEGLKDDQATIAMYDAANQEAVKSALFAKLKASDRAFIRTRNRGECEKKIAAAKEKGKETFELGGFYLGMNISDVDELVGYYCPEWSNSEGYVDDDKTIRGLWVPQQTGAFCRAGKDGKVFEFNFGKNFLKNFYKFDVQNEREWAAAYSRKEGVDLRYVHLNEDVKVVDYNDPGVPYHALYSQDTYTYKNNSKDYRVTYFGEQKIAAGNGIVKQAARGQMQYVGGQQGMLRVRIEKD